MGDDVSESFGVLDKGGRYSSWLREPRAEPSASEGIVARGRLLRHGAVMSGEEFAIFLAFVISCHPAALPA